MRRHRPFVGSQSALCRSSRRCHRCVQLARHSGGHDIDDSPCSGAACLAPPSCGRPAHRRRPRRPRRRAAAARRPGRRHRPRPRSRPTNMATRRSDRRHRRQAARLGGRRHPAREHARLRATSARPARPTSPSCSTRSRRRSAARAAAAASSPVLLLNGQRISELPRASRHSDRSDPAGRDPARGSRAQIRLSRRPEGREHRPSPALPLDRRAGSAAASRPTAAMPAAMATSPG